MQHSDRSYRAKCAVQHGRAAAEGGSRSCRENANKLCSMTKSHFVQSVQELTKTPAAPVEDPACHLEEGQDS